MKGHSTFLVRNRFFPAMTHKSVTQISVNSDSHKTACQARWPDGWSLPTSSFCELHADLSGHLDEETQLNAVDSQLEQQKAARGANTAENVRYVQTISEGGMGGKTTEAGGFANQGLYPARS